MGTVESQVRLAAVTPWQEGAPAIHGPAIYGASVGKPLLYALATTGEGPLRFTAEGLPEGLSLHADTGHITGSVRQEGHFEVLLCAENAHGTVERDFRICVGDGLALTPPMGWNSWNAWRHWVSDAKVRCAADELVRTGLAARGYSYVNIDSCWQGTRGGSFGAIQGNAKFPDMRSLADHIHGLGLKLGIYSTPWTIPWGCTTEEAEQVWGGPQLIGCSSGAPDPAYTPNSLAEGRFVGVDKHEAQDVAQWMEWGVDYLKYDWNPTDVASLERMGRLIRTASRDVVLSLCTRARYEDVDTIKTWANMWRNLPDTTDRWACVLENAFFLESARLENWRQHVAAGSWHDLDMLALGPQFESATTCCANKLSQDEQITAMTAWALYPSPLILSCDLSALSDFEARLFGNEEVIAVNQDALGEPSVRLRQERYQAMDTPQPHTDRHIWARPLADGGFAVGFFNLSERPDEISVRLEDLGLSQTVCVRNLWERRDLGRCSERVSVDVPAHGAQLLRIQ
jgi:alpha-galactosidase